MTLALGAAGAHAASPHPVSGLRMTIEKPHFICSGSGASLSRAGFRPVQSVAAPLACCGGQSGCAQFLSTDTVLRASHRWHS